MAVTTRVSPPEATEEAPRGLSGTMKWEVAAKKGCLVRCGHDLSSELVCVLPRWSGCVSHGEVAETADGAVRVRLVSPVVGWASVKCLREQPELRTCATSGRARWAVDIGSTGISPGSPAWQFLLGLIAEPGEREAVGKFVRVEDKTRALVSRLLARRCCAVALEVEHGHVEIARTKGKKPFVTAATKSRSDSSSRFPNFNFNVSHEGRFVVVASEPRCVCGVDVAAPDQFRRRGRAEPDDLANFFRAMRDVLSPREWAFVRAGNLPLEAQAERFRYFWSCKEAFTKARGDGLAFGLGRAEFDLVITRDAPVSFQASVKVDGANLGSWRFYGDQLPDGHIVTVARGPPADVVDANGTFRRTLSLGSINHDDLEALHPPFQFLTLRDLVPPTRLQEFDALTSTV